MGRIVFRSLLLLVVLVTASAKDIPISSSYVIKHTDSCPDVGYYFRRDLAPNSIDPGPCYLCFCQGKGKAACWARESKRCDVEKYHFHRVGRDLHENSNRVRRSPVSLSDIFFRDATRDFFNKNLPEECKPFEESFSDGCPPADWCIGCTICDCDANGRWDCHILSFCNDEEKKKIDGVKIPPPKSKRTGKKGGYRPFRKPRTATKVTTLKPTKKATPKPTRKTTPKPTKKPTKPTKKVVKKDIRKVIRKVNKNDTKTQNINSKRRRIIIKRKADNQKIKQKRENPEQTIKEIIIKKGIATHKPLEISNTIIKGLPNNTNTEYQLGQMLVKRVMSSVQRLVQMELDKLNQTMERMKDGSDCEEIQRRNQQKRHPPEFKYKKIGEEFRWLRDKRDVSKQTATSYDDNGIETTTDNIDVLEITNHSTSGNWNNEPEFLSVPLNISQTNNEINFKDAYNVVANYEVAPAVKKSDNNNTVLNEKREMKKGSFETIVNNNTAINKIYKINTTKQINNNITDIIPEFYGINSSKISKIKNYKYKIDHNPTEKAKVITTISISTNTPVTGTIESNVYRKQTERKLGVTKKYNLKRLINKNFKDLSSIYFPINKALNERRPSIKNNLVMKNKNMLKRNSTQKLKSKFNFMKYIRKIFNKMFFGKKKYLQKKDDEYQIIRILCQNIKACNIDKKNRNILKTKIRKINAETYNIFRTMKTIKGLLHLIDIPNYNNTSNIKDDIKKLNFILRHTNGSFSKNISVTQKMQMEYIKQNTKTFTESVGRFTELLNDIIFILQKNKQETLKPSRFSNKNISESFEKIRRLLIKHNLVENTFIKKIYNMLSDVENKVKSNKTQVSGKRTNHEVIESYSRSIIDNLRKLKGLAQALNSSRRKRDAMGDDDTVEYLLLLMEYLIKKEHPVPVEAANDGIDLLIDTIKSAPDIKSIKEKVLQNFPSSVDSVSASSGEKDSGVKDSISDSSSISKETNVSTIIDNIDVVYKAMPYEDDVIAQTSYEKVNPLNLTEDVVYENVENVTDVPVLSEDQQEKTGFEKFESTNVVDGNRYETFTEDDDIYPTVVNNTITTKESTPLAEPYYEFQETTTLKIKENPADDSHGNLEWIEENFGNEVREVKHDFDVIIKIESNDSMSTTTTSTEAPKNDVDNNVSNVSQEVNSKNKKKMSTEEVMYRKQMDLLNSLDYGPPKLDFDETKSEDDEKFMPDSYF